MRGNTAEPRFERYPKRFEFAPERAEPGEFAAAAAHQIAEAVVEVAGPLLWAMLAAGLLTAALGHQ